jgi:hypothetical protein
MRTLSNSFHNTEVKTRMTKEDQEKISFEVYQGTATKSEKAKMRRIWKKLCGIKKCTCGNDWGER